MKREVERETDDRGQKKLIKCCHLEMLSHQWELIYPNVFLKRRGPNESCLPCEDKVNTIYCSIGNVFIDLFIKL